MNDEKNGTSAIWTNPKKFGIALGLCCFILAVLALVASNINTEVKRENTTAVTTTDKNVEVKVTDIPDTRNDMTIAVPATEVTTKNQSAANAEDETAAQAADAPPESYMLPMGTDIGNDYSMGVPVYNEVMADWRTHDGVDFNGAYGDTVKAIADGTVKDVYEDELWGTVVVINHGGGVEASYCGLQKESVLKKGEIIEKGDRIGVIGEIPIENAAEFPHLHLEIRVDGETADPLQVMGYYE